MNPDPWDALINANMWHELIHMYLAGYIVAGFIVAAVYAYAWLKGRRDRYHRTALVVTLAFASLAAPVQVVVGDWAGRQVAESQPVKLAAFEGLARTQEGAPFTIGGFYDEATGELNGGIEIPKLLSLLATHDPNGEVIGLDSVPPEDRPPVNIVRYAFHTMIAIGTGLALLGTLFFVTWLRKHRLPRSKWFYRAVMVAGPLSLVAMIAGWITTEVGRQPWIVYEVMRTEQAVTSADGLEVGYVFLVTVYLALGAGVVWLLRRLAQRPPATEVGTPAAPADRGALMLPEICLGLVMLGISAYAVLGSADFGAGFWDLTAGGAERGGRLRGMVQRSMSPVWEANHVWLIFVLVIVWTAFPVAFGSLFSTLSIPLFLAAIGIIFRGAAFALRGQAATIREARFLGALFALSSVLIPFFLGAALGGIASGRVEVGNAVGDPVTSWLNPTSVLVGVIAVLSGAYLAAVFLAGDSQRAELPDLVRAFRTRALATGVVTGVVALGGLLVVRDDAPDLYDGLTSGGGLAMVVLSGLAGVVTLGLVWRERYGLARATSALAVICVTVGWALAQRPLSPAAGAHARRSRRERCHADGGRDRRRARHADPRAVAVVPVPAGAAGAARPGVRAARPALPAAHGLGRARGAPMTRRPLLLFMLASLAIGLVLMLLFEATLTRIVGVTALFAFIVSGVFLIADPAFLGPDED